VSQRLAYLTVMTTFSFLRLPPRSDHDIEILVLRHQLEVLQQQLAVLSWHRDLLRRSDAAACVPRRRGRPRTVRSIRVLVLRLARENSTWGYRRTRGELVALDIKVAASTVWEILKDHGIDPSPERRHTACLTFYAARQSPCWLVNSSRFAR
jgi:putative transposase